VTAPTLRRLAPPDAAALANFYNGLSRASLTTFRPIGWETTVDVCREIARDNQPDRERRYDLAAFAAPAPFDDRRKAGSGTCCLCTPPDRVHDDAIIGWSFLRHSEPGEASFGLGIADAWQGRGVGTQLARRVMAAAPARRLRRVILTVARDNQPARTIYERLGFAVYDEFIEPTEGLPFLRMAVDVLSARD
jgi:RimJ/RimL family protein N-acetyltransferase